MIWPREVADVQNVSSQDALSAECHNFEANVGNVARSRSSQARFQDPLSTNKQTNSKKPQWGFSCDSALRSRAASSGVQFPAPLPGSPGLTLNSSSKSSPVPTCPQTQKYKWNHLFYNKKAHHDTLWRGHGLVAIGGNRRRDQSTKPSICLSVSARELPLLGPSGTKEALPHGRGSLERLALPLTGFLCGSASCFLPCYFQLPIKKKGNQNL